MEGIDFRVKFILTLTAVCNEHDEWEKKPWTPGRAPNYADFSKVILNRSHYHNYGGLDRTSKENY